MSFPTDTFNVAGYVVLGATSVVSGGIWFAGQVAEVPTSVVSAAGTNAITACVLTIAAMTLNGWLGDRKARRESEERVATAQETIDRKVAEARAESLGRITTLEARLAVAAEAERANADARHAKMDQLYTLITGLVVHATESGVAINALIPAVQQNSAIAGTPIPAVEPIEPIVVASRTPTRT